VGRYVVDAMIGAGGMGVVYAAHDPQLERKLALKALRSDRFGASMSEAILRREAMAMARLTHPNVVGVYDLFTAGGTAYVAMELIDGMTLRGWLRASPRSVREILDTIMQAGRGLRAAHEEGIVHRDFKPENVLCAPTGRVCVSDFGLARVAAGAEPAGGASTSTHTGIAGTPRYMAPEQFAGSPATASSDQYSFCVVLHEALFGVLPPPEPVDRSVRSRLAPNVRGRLPARVHRVLARGLQVEPSARYATMAALLADLAEAVSIGRRWLALGAIGAIALGGVATWLLQRGADDHAMCKGAWDRVGQVWSPSRKQAIAAAFAATHKPYAADAWQRVERGIDAYMKGWAAMRTDACEATRVRKEQAEDMLELRMQCLDRRMQDVVELTAVFASADAKVALNSVSAVNALDSLVGCADTAALRARVKPPSDLGARTAVVALGGELANISALTAAGRIRDGMVHAHAAAERAHKLGYRPLEAEAEALLAELNAKNGDFKQADHNIRVAVEASIAGNDDKRLVGSLWRLAFIDGQLGRHAEAQNDLHLAAAVVERLGGDDQMRAELAYTGASLQFRQGHYAEAKQVLQPALDIWQRAPGPKLTRGLIMAASIANAQGRFAEGLELGRRALERTEKELGPNHPEVAFAIEAVAGALARLGRLDEAVDAFKRSAAIREQALDPDNALIGSSLTNIAEALIGQDKYTEALPYAERALAIIERAVGPDHRDVAQARRQLGLIYLARREYVRAREQLQRALDITIRSVGNEHDDIAALFHYLANVAKAEGRPREAISLEIRSIAMFDKMLGPDHPDLAEPLSGLGELYLAGHRPVLAIVPLERVLALPDLRPIDQAPIRFMLARALVQSHRDGKRARQLAIEARDAYGSDAQYESERAQINAWLAAQRRS